MTAGATPAPASGLRVGMVLRVESFPQARKPAWKIQVDFGDRGTLWTSAQVTHYSEDDLVGRLVVGLLDVGSRRIAGFTSEFLLLGADSPGGVRLLTADAGARPGDRVC